MGKFIVVALLLGACAGDEAPSCQTAIGHYYASGCALGDISTNPPMAFTQAKAQTFCQDVNARVPDRCQGEFDDWKTCLDSTPSSAKTNADCNCSNEQDALFGCQ